MLEGVGTNGSYAGKKKSTPAPAASVLLGQAAAKGPVPARTTTASAGATTPIRQAVLAAPVTANQYSGTGLTGNATATDVATAAAAAPAAPAMSQADYLAGDSTYQGALAALKKTMAGYTADHDTNETKYDSDYNEGLKNLGWQTGANSWNQDDTNTAYGRSYANQLNDFGSRDMLSSSFYGDALNDMIRQFNDQKGDIDKARTNYRDDQDSTLAAEQNQTDSAKQQAMAEAIARMAAGVALPSAS